MITYRHPMSSNPLIIHLDDGLLYAEWKLHGYLSIGNTLSPNEAGTAKTPFIVTMMHIVSDLTDPQPQENPEN